MLKSLFIQDFILIERSFIEFTTGFNVITGETGSGKSAIISSLGLFSGQKASSDQIRQGKDRALIEAVFENLSDEALQFLANSGIEVEDNTLIIKREISLNGKSKAYINHRQVQTGFLRLFSPYLFDVVSQNDNRCLKEYETHQKFFDAYGHLIPLKKEVRIAFENWQEAHLKLNKFEASLREKNERIERLNNLLSDILEVDPKVDEEETLFSEYRLLANSTDLISGLQAVSNLIEGEERSLLGPLSDACKRLSSLTRIDPSLTPLEVSLKETLIQLRDVLHSLDRSQQKIESNPFRMEEISTRLEKITRLKKKYGPELADVLIKKDQAEKEMDELDKSEEFHIHLMRHLEGLESFRNEKAEQLSKARHSIADHFDEKLQNELKCLNMASAKFKTKISLKNCGIDGKDRIEFFLAPNSGEPFISLSESASGGEVSRVLMALMVLTTQETLNKTIIFDEIDANIGGTSAKKVGEKLSQIGEKAQVIAITHFPQVAIQASNHVHIYKQVKDGRTVTFAEEVAGDIREKELCRMKGE